MPTVLLLSFMAAKDEVMTTRLTVGAFFLVAFRIPIVPITAIKAVSRDIRPGNSIGQDPVTWIEYFLLDIGGIEVIRASSMDDGLEGRFGNDSLVEC